MGLPMFLTLGQNAKKEATCFQRMRGSRHVKTGLWPVARLSIYAVGTELGVINSAEGCILGSVSWERQGFR